MIRFSGTRFIYINMHMNDVRRYIWIFIYTFMFICVYVYIYECSYRGICPLTALSYQQYLAYSPNLNYHLLILNLNVNGESLHLNPCSNIRIHVLSFIRYYSDPLIHCAYSNNICLPEACLLRKASASSPPPLSLLLNP
jgi:hypothetical protein